MSHTIQLAKVALGRYGTALASSGRRDIAAHFLQFIAETGLYTEDRTNLSIDIGWIEQPQLAENRDKLAGV